MYTVFAICLIVLVIFGPIVKIRQWQKLHAAKEERAAWFEDAKRISVSRIFMFIVGLGMLWFPFSILILGYSYGNPSDNSTVAVVGALFGTLFFLLSLFYTQVLALSKQFVYDKDSNRTELDN